MIPLTETLIKSNSCDFIFQQHNSSQNQLSIVGYFIMTDLPNISKRKRVSVYYENYLPVKGTAIYAC